MIQINDFTLHDAHKARGVVVVIDVLRAFTTAAHAFNAGAARILPVARVEETFQLRKTLPDAFIMGEVDGEKPAGFDFGNSPGQFNGWDLSGRTMIQRTSAGTQGIVAANRADHLFAASFVVAKATALAIQLLHPSEVSFVITGESMGRDGDEDRACANYIQDLILKKCPVPETYLQRVRHSTAGRSFLSDEKHPELGEDLELSIDADRFAFSMPVIREGNLRVMHYDYL